MPPRQRLVRRRPLLERISSWLSPSDLFLWISEEIQTRELGAKPVGKWLGLSCNFVFLIARANSGAATAADDVFSEPRSHWAAILATQVVRLLVFVSFANAIALTYQKRHYRLFEANVEKRPGTPSAQRVRVQSSPMSSSPMRFFTDALGSETAESRAHPDKTRDVWEIAVWDPIPACLEGFVYFSPAHVLVHMFALPVDSMEGRPSVTVLKCLVLQVCFSVLLGMLQSMNDQRQKDAAIIQGEVMREYNTKYVHPRLHPKVRDVGIQASPEDQGGDIVETGIATTLLRRGFQTHPSQNYIKHIDPDGVVPSQSSTTALNQRLVTPSSRSRHSDVFASTQQQASRPRPRQSMPPGVSTPSVSTSSYTPVNNQAATTSTGTNFGGSLGVFTHANSPLKKATSLNDINNAAGYSSPRNSREMAAMEQREAMERAQRRASPLKQSALADVEDHHSGFTPAPPKGNIFASNRNRYSGERYPSRW